MKICSKCRVEKPFSEFYKDSRIRLNGEEGYQSICKSCKKIYQSNRHEILRFEEDYISAQERYKRNTVAANKAYVQNYLQTHPCVDCGESDWVVLEFDHVRGEKDKSIADLLRYAGNRLKKEIEKCDVRCANCHRRVTYQRAGQWRIIETVDLAV